MSAPSLWFRLGSQLNDVFDLNPAGALSHNQTPEAILCLSETSTSMPMWAHYGSSGQGIVLEFDMQTSFFGQYPPKKVLYRSKRPSAGVNNANVIKSLEWAYEKEWRCFTIAGKSETNNEEFLAHHQVVRVPFPYSSLTAIIYGYDSIVDCREFLARPEASHVVERVCRIDPWSYKLNLRQLDDIRHILENRKATGFRS